MMVQHPKGENAIEGSKLVAIELYEIYGDEFAARPVAHPGSLDIRIANFGEYLRRALCSRRINHWRALARLPIRRQPAGHTHGVE